MNLNGEFIIDAIDLTDYVSDFNINRPEIQNGLHKALLVIYNPGGRWNTVCDIGKSVEMKLGWGSTPGTFLKGKIYDRKRMDGDKLELFVGQLSWNEMLFQTQDEIMLDKEVSDIVKNILSGTSIGVTNVEFGSGAEVTDAAFHTDSYSNELNIESKSNVILTAGTWDLSAETDPPDGDAWTNNNSSDWDVDADITLGDEATIKQVGTHSISGEHGGEYEVDGNTRALYHCNDGGGVTVDDATANNYDLTTNSDWGVGKFGGCLDFEAGNSDYAYNTTIFDVVPVNGTWEFWIKPETVAYARLMTIVQGANAQVMEINSNGKVTFFLYTGGTGRWNLQSDNGAVSIGNWTHIAGTWGSAGAKLYIGGDLVDSDPATDRFTDHATNDFSVATYGMGGGSYYDGLMDEIRCSDVQRTTFKTGGGTNREMWYITTKDLSKNLNNKVQIDFYIRQDNADQDPELRLYSSAGNYMKRTVSITSADAFERFQYPVGSGASGWTEVGTMDWADVDWIAWYWSSSQTTITMTYIDGLHFDQYESSGYIISNDMVTTDYDYFDDAKLDVTITTPSGTSITIKACNDGGTTYETFTDNTWKQFTDHHSSADNHGRIFKYKIEFVSDGTDTPTLSAIDIDVKYIPIIILSKFERRAGESRLQSIQKLARINNSDGYMDTTPDCHFFPKTTKSSGITISRQKGVWNFDDKKDEHRFRNKVILHGALDPTHPLDKDDWTEQDASRWTGNDITVSDEATTKKFNDYSIKGVMTGGSGWADDCNDDSLNATYYDWSTNGTGTVIESGGYIETSCDASGNDGVIYFDKINYPLTGDYEILFDFFQNRDLFRRLFCVFLTNVEIPYWTDPVPSKNKPYLTTTTERPAKLKLCTGDGSTYITLADDVLETYNTIKITRSGSTVTIWLNGAQKWSGTFTEPGGAHQNFQFGCTDVNSGTRYMRLDNFNYSYSGAGGNILSPDIDAFGLNLDHFDYIWMWYRQNSWSDFEIRLEKDASNYFSWTISPARENEFFEIELPVGSTSVGWNSTGSPKWTSIKYVRFVYSSGSATSIFFIDKLHFNSKEIIVYSELTSGSYGTAAYGIKELRLFDRSIEDREYAKKIVKSIREELDDPMEIITFNSLLNIGIDPGDSVTLIVPDRSISGLYYVKNISYKKGYYMKCTLTNNDETLEHLLLGFDTHDRQLGVSVTTSDAPEVCAD